MTGKRPILRLREEEEKLGGKYECRVNRRRPWKCRPDKPGDAGTVEVHQGTVGSEVRRTFPDRLSCPEWNAYPGRRC